MTRIRLQRSGEKRMEITVCSELCDKYLLKAMPYDCQLDYIYNEIFPHTPAFSKKTSFKKLSFDDHHPGRNRSGKRDRTYSVSVREIYKAKGAQPRRFGTPPPPPKIYYRDVIRSKIYLSSFMPERSLLLFSPSCPSFFLAGSREIVQTRNTP